MLGVIALIATLALMSFSACVLSWLGIMLPISAKQKTWGLVGITVCLLAGAVYHFVQVILLFLQYSDSSVEFIALLRVIAWSMLIVIPLAYYSLMLWLGDYSLTDLPIVHRIGWSLCAGMALLSGILLWLTWHESVPPQPVFIHANPAWSESTPSFFVWSYGLYSLLSHLLGWQMLEHAAKNRPIKRSRVSLRSLLPWLRIYTMGQIIGSLLTILLYTSVFLMVAQPENSASMMMGVTILLVVISTVSFLSLGYATVVYEAFSGQVLGRKIFHSLWNNTLWLAFVLSSLIGGLLVWQIPLEGSLLALSVAFVGYHIWNSGQMMRAAEKKLPLSKQQLDTSDASERTLLQNEFDSICCEHLDAKHAVLVPTGVATPFIEDYLCYPDSHAVESLPSLESGTYSIHQSIYLTQNPDYPWILMLWSRRGLLGLLYLSQRENGRLYTIEECQLAQQRIIELLEAVISTTITTHLMDLQRNRLAETRVMDLQTRRRLHDDVLPSLHMAILALHATGSTSSEVVIQEAIDELGNLHQQISDLIRTVPQYQPDNQQDLLPLLNQMLREEFASAFDTVTLQTDLEQVYVPPMILEVVNGAIYEGLRNAAIHGRGEDASRPLNVTLSVTYISDLVIEISDDGVGLQAETSNHGGSHHGLTLHNTLVSVVGGTITIANIPSGGTRFTLSIARRAIKDQSTSIT